MFKDAPASESDWDQESAGRDRGASSTGPRRDIIALRAPATETPPATDRRAEPAEKTERPTEPAKKEAEPGQESEAQEKKPRRTA